MRQFLNILGMLILISGISSSCKESTLDTLRDNELATLDKYVKTNNLTENKDVSGIYLKITERSNDTTLIRSGYKVMLEFTITLIDGKAIQYYDFTTDDGSGRHYEPFAFYVDVSNDIVNANYVQQIAGLHRGLKKMHAGDRAFMVIPSELAFKAVDNSSIGIPRFSTLLATVYAKKVYSIAQQNE